MKARIAALLACTLLGFQQAPFAQQGVSKSAETAQVDAAFTRDVASLFKNYCLSCHSGPKSKGGISLEEFTSPASLAKNRQTWEQVRQIVRAREMPPDKKPRPTDPEIDAFTDWLERHYAGIDAKAKADPGRVTIRRLNRAEYNNTIRDLVGVAFQPADDFPADDVGYGFDNIGDVLSLPPIMLEKYMAAAERIMTAAIVKDAPPPTFTKRWAAVDLESTPPAASSKLRGVRSLFSNCEIGAAVDVPANGEYVVRVRGFGQQAGKEPAKLAFRAEGKDLRTVEVTATVGEPKTYETRVKLAPGKRRIAVAFVNDFYDPGNPDPKQRDRNLIIEWMEIFGPIDAPQRYLIESHQKIMIAQPGAGMDKRTAARKIIASFARRAFRRPVTAPEVDRLMRLFELADNNGESFERAIQFPCQAILVSPHFLFRVETDPDPSNPAVVHPVNEFELATRLSYFLWSSMPDEELFRLAEQGELRKPGVLATQVARMTKDPKARGLVENFAGQWLQIRNLRSAQPDPVLFSSWDESLRSAMILETELYFDHVMKEDRSLLEFIDSDYTFANERLAQHYGLSGIRGSQFRKVAVKPGQRGGILTHASVLTVTSNPTRTSPVKRGKWILETILGTPPPPPDPNAGMLSEEKEAVLSGTLRQRMEQHRQKPECISCHSRMDPLGFGFENYDAIGGWRTADGKFPLDTSGTLPTGQSFATPAELKAILKTKQEAFARCLTEKMLTYALGRGLESYDRRAVDSIVAQLKQDDYRFSTLLRGIVMSDPFQKRRGQKGGHP